MKTQASMRYVIPTNPKSGVITVPAEPVGTFAIAPHPPEAVALADENFRRLAGEYAETKSQIAEATELREAEVHQAHAAAAAARVDKSKPPAKTPDKIEAEWDAKIVALQAELLVVADALDQAGDTLVATIPDAKAEWLKELDAIDEAATAKLEAALGQVEEAIEELNHARSAPRWVREFAGGSDPRPYSGGVVGGYSAIQSLYEIVHGRKELVGYRDSAPIWEQQGGPVAKQGARS